MLAETGVLDRGGQAGPPPVDMSDRRWISKRLEQLDAERDYAEIVRLTSSYSMNKFVLDWSYAVTMPRFNLGPSAKAISRGGTGKIMTNSNRRVADTSAHVLVWAEYGPDSPETRRSVEIINALHARWWKEYPDEFTDPDLWMYVIAWEACGPLTLFESLGLPGPSEKEKRARVIFATKLAELFIYIDGRMLPEVIPVPQTYEELAAFITDYEGKNWEFDTEMEMCGNQVLSSFEDLFPRPLRWFGRALATGFWHPGIFVGAGIKAPSRPVRWVGRTAMKSMIRLGGLAPDPKETWPEKLTRRAAEKGTPLNSVLRSAQAAGAADTSSAKGASPSGGQCPMGFGSSAASESRAS